MIGTLAIRLCSALWQLFCSIVPRHCGHWVPETQYVWLFSGMDSEGWKNGAGIVAALMMGRTTR